VFYTAKCDHLKLIQKFGGRAPPRSRRKTKVLKLFMQNPTRAIPPSAARNKINSMKIQNWTESQCTASSIVARSVKVKQSRMEISCSVALLCIAKTVCTVRHLGAFGP